MADGVRYRPGKDEHARSSSFYHFDKESVSFKNVVASGTSTLMSLSAMFTGRNSVELFPTFPYVINGPFPYLTYMSILREKGYEFSASIMSNWAGRSCFANVLGSGNPQVIRIVNGGETLQEFQYIMENRFNNSFPQFVYLSFNTGPDRDQSIDQVIQYLKDNSLYDDSFVILSSDHGFKYLGSTRMTRRFCHFWFHRSHGYYICKDKYRANLNIKMPSRFGISVGQAIGERVSLMDTFDTVFDYLGIEYSCSSKSAVSLRPLIDHKADECLAQYRERCFRVDTRYIYQEMAKTRLLTRNSDVLIRNFNFESVDNPLAVDFFHVSQESAKRDSSKLVVQRFKQSDLAGLAGLKIALYNEYNRDFLSLLKELLSEKNQVDIADYRSIRRYGRCYDLVVAITDNQPWSKCGRLYRYCKQVDQSITIRTSLFTEATNFDVNPALEIFARWKIAGVKRSIIFKLFVTAYLVICDTLDYFFNRTTIVLPVEISKKNSKDRVPV
jgi:hypothetical protein